MTQRVSSASPFEGQIGFCRALRSGDRILVSGTAPIGTDGKTVAGDAAAQMRRCLEIITDSVRQLGGESARVVRTRMFLTDAADWQAIGTVHGDFFRHDPPVATMVVVATLLDSAWKVEVEAEAVVPAISIADATEADRKWLRERSVELFGAPVVISRGRALVPAGLPALIARRDNEIIGLATYEIRDPECELVTLDAFHPWQGIGTLLIHAVEHHARAAGCTRLWLITTNDNTDALRFYQRRGYHLRALHSDAIRHSRELKPAIPHVGHHQIPIRDELELEKLL